MKWALFISLVLSLGWCYGNSITHCPKEKGTPAFVVSCKQIAVDLQGEEVSTDDDNDDDFTFDKGPTTKVKIIWTRVIAKEAFAVIEVKATNRKSGITIFGVAEVKYHRKKSKWEFYVVNEVSLLTEGWLPMVGAFHN